MSKSVQFDQGCLKSILKGVQTVAKVMGATFGPGGAHERRVWIQEDWGLCLSTRERRSVVESIVLPDKWENLGVKIAQGIATRMWEQWGEGGATAVMIAETILREGTVAIFSGADSLAIKRGIDRAVAVMSGALDQLAVSIQEKKELECIGASRVQFDKTLQKVVTKIIEKVGSEMVRVISRRKSSDQEAHVVEGIQMDQGYLSPYFINSPQEMTVRFEKPFVLILDQKLSSFQQITPILEKVHKFKAYPLLIIAKALEKEAFSTVVLNKVHREMPICAIRAPDDQECLQDLALRLGGQVVKNDFTQEMLTRVKSISVEKEKTTIFTEGEVPFQVKKRVEEIQAKVNSASSKEQRDLLQKRLRCLSRFLAFIYVDGDSHEKRGWVEKALHASRQAAVHKVVPGGGVAWVRVVKALDNLSLQGDEKVGARLVYLSAFTPLMRIAENCGRQVSAVVRKVCKKDGFWGYNGDTNDYGDLLKDGVVDLAVVAQAALRNGASIASYLLNVGAVVG